MSSQSKKMSEFSRAKSNSIESDYVNRNEMKRIENTYEKGLSSEFDKLNESLYKINNFLKLSKDIEDMKKENLVKNDIQRKLSLKSQWLNSNHGSTASLNSLPPTILKPNCSSHGSTQSLNKGDAKKENDLARKRKNFANFKSQSVQNVNVENERPVRRRLGKRSTGSSFDELNFIDKLKLSDEDVSRLSQEREFQDTNDNDGLSKVNALKGRLRAQSESLGSSVSSSQRDLSKYFPKREIKAKPQNVNKSQKELKDVDLSKYFLPSPVQESRSLPSPGQSPKLPRKPLNIKPKEENNTTTLLRTAIDNLQKLKKSESEEPYDDSSSAFQSVRDSLQKVAKSKSEDHSNEPSAFRNARDNLQKVELKKEDFTMLDQQLDGDVSLKPPPRLNKLKFKQANESEAPYSGYESIPLDGEKDECEKLFDCMKSPVDNIDELFDKVAADVIPELPKRKVIEKVPLKNQPPKIIRKFAVKKPIEIKKVEIKPNFAPASKWCRKESFHRTNKQEADILSKLSSNLLNEIKLLEQHLQLNEEQNEKKEKEEKKVKKVKQAKKVTEPESEFLGTEEELNNAIDDILNAVSYKEDVSLNKPKKVTLVNLPKASKGAKSIVDPFASVDAKMAKTVEPPQMKTKEVKSIERKPLETKPAEIKPSHKEIKSAPKENVDTRANIKSQDTVDFAFNPKLVEPVPKPKSIEPQPKLKTPSLEIKPILQRVPSIDDESVTFTFRKPSVSEIQPPAPKPERAVPKFEIIPSTPTIEKEVVSFTLRRSPSPVREIKPVESVDKHEAEPIAVNYSYRARSMSKERDSNLPQNNSFKNDSKVRPTVKQQEVEPQQLRRTPSKDRELAKSWKADDIVQVKQPEFDQSDLVSFTVRKPSISEVNKISKSIAKQEPELQKIDAAPSKENNLVKVRESSLNEVFKVQLPKKEEAKMWKSHSTVPQQSPMEVRKRTPSREREAVPIRKASIKEMIDVQPVNHTQQPEMKIPEIDKKDLMSFMIKKPLSDTKTVQKPLEMPHQHVDQTTKPNITDVRNSFFDEPTKPERFERQKEQNHKRFEQNEDRSSYSNNVQIDPPVKPARRRKLSKSDDEQQVSMRQQEPSPIPVRKDSFSNKNDERKIHANNNDLHKLTSESEKNEIPELSHIARLLDTHKMAPENDASTANELVASNKQVESSTQPNNDNNKLDNEKFKHVQFRNYDDQRNEHLDSIDKSEHRWSDYDNVPSSSKSQRAKLDRNFSRSFDTPYDTDREYRDYDNVSYRRSEERSSPAKVSSLDRKKNVTDMLLARSKNLHNKKQEFMNEKLETNPYIRRMREKETRFRPAYRDRSISPLASSSHYDYPSTNYEYHQPYSHSISRPLPSSTTAANSHLSYNPRTTATSSSGGRSVLDMFRSPTSSNKDSCIIS